MAYTPNVWEPRTGQGLNKFTDANTGNVLELENTPDSVTSPGTPFSADWMNHIETGIQGAAQTADEALSLNPNMQPFSGSIDNLTTPGQYYGTASGSSAGLPFSPSISDGDFYVVYIYDISSSALTGTVIAQKIIFYKAQRTTESGFHPTPVPIADATNPATSQEWLRYGTVNTSSGNVTWSFPWTLLGDDKSVTLDLVPNVVPGTCDANATTTPGVYLTDITQLQNGPPSLGTVPSVATTAWLVVENIQTSVDPADFGGNFYGKQTLYTMTGTYVRAGGFSSAFSLWLDWQLQSGCVIPTSGLSSGGNFNTLTTPGRYSGNGTFTNAPQSGQFYLIVENIANYLRQTADFSGQIYERWGNTTGTWNDWTKMLNDSTPVPVANGGTGGTTPTAARNNIGIYYEREAFTIVANQFITSVQISTPGIASNACIVAQIVANENSDEEAMILRKCQTIVARGANAITVYIACNPNESQTYDISGEVDVFWISNS